VKVKLPDKWDMEYDVVVVGWGAGGTASAVTAHMEGAEVLILEKMPEGGGNTRVSGGNIIVPTDMKFVDYLEVLSFKTVSRDILEVFVENAMKNGEWIKEMGGELQVFMPLEVSYPMMSPGAGFPQIEGAETIVKHNIKGTAEEGKPSQRLWNFLAGLVAKRDIKTLTSTAVTELISNIEGEIIGVRAEKEGATINIKARRAVILTCGGYENEPELKWDYLPAKPVMFLGNPGNTGDGIKMVQRVGADLWHMTRLSCSVGFKAPGFEAAFPVSFLNEGFIFVDKSGQRFSNEAAIETHEYYRYLSEFDVEKMEFPRVPMWAIFDEQTRRNGPLNRPTAGYNRGLYSWSLDNATEVEKGWILRGATVAELAAKLSVTPETLEQTINRYNEYCQAGKDADFNRAREDLRALKAPFYAIQLWPALINTQGGPRRDKESRVLDPDGKPIPRLYAAGELGSIWGYLYQGACNIGEALVFGRIAGQHAAREKPWS
jgi:succinate dehydrogenase/fumarate reductase flavoprotein subunit